MNADYRQNFVCELICVSMSHEDADDLVALLFEQIRRHRGVHAPAQPHHDSLLCLVAASGGTALNIR